ncbi:MAG: A/G-specific adenine glycosylase [Calditrichia bacterium]
MHRHQKKNKSSEHNLIEWFYLTKRDLPWRTIPANPYFTFVSEYMLQQTQVNTVIPYFNRFIKKYPTIHDLAKASEQEVLKEWEGLGYYSRARNIRKAAIIIEEKFDGVIPEAYEELISLPGIGDYIASAILAFGFGKKVAVVDTNVKRVAARYFGIKNVIGSRATKEIKQKVQSMLPNENSYVVSEALMEIGAILCKVKDPDCKGCPLSQFCRAYKENIIDELILSAPRKKSPVYRVVVAIIEYGDEVYIQRRPSEGHLGGLWEFPGGKVKSGESEKEALYRELEEEIGQVFNEAEFLMTIRHQYSHFGIIMDVFRISVAEKFTGKYPEHRWEKKEKLVKYPFPKANLKIFKKLNINL